MQQAKFSGLTPLGTAMQQKILEVRSELSLVALFVLV